MHVKVFCDGGSRGNPGPSASGVVIESTGGEIIEEFGKYLGIQTNNYAEYSAVVEALKKLKELEVKKADFYLDSELVVKQLNGAYKVKNANIKPLYEEVISLKVDLDVSFTHIYRNDNKAADAMVNKVLDDIDE